MAGEFDLIRDYFRDATAQRDDVVLGIGDDCALLEVPVGKQLAVSMDTLVVGRHFVADVDPELLGHKALAVNLSDLAAMGAIPAWVTLSVTLPDADAEWVKRFMAGFTALAKRYQLTLIGGDTTRGPLAITVQVHGFVDPEKSLRRDAAKIGDLIYVSGQLGDAGLALMAQQGLYVKQGSLASLKQRLDRPEPRIELGLMAATHSHCAIDLSDGLGSDLGHICEESNVGALIYLDKLPMSDAVAEYVAESGDWSLPLSAGDDYELCMTVPAQHQAAFEAAMQQQEVPVTWIGMIEQGEQVRAMSPNGDVDAYVARGYDHFAN
jgi:thiamine-monophosphate kinase